MSDRHKSVHSGNPGRQKGVQGPRKPSPKDTAGAEGERPHSLKRSHIKVTDATDRSGVGTATPQNPGERVTPAQSVTRGSSVAAGQVPQTPPEAGGREEKAPSRPRPAPRPAAAAAAAAAAAEQPPPTEQTESTLASPEIVTILDDSQDTHPSEEPERADPAMTSVADKETCAQDQASNVPSSRQQVPNKQAVQRKNDADKNKDKSVPSAPRGQRKPQAPPKPVRVADVECPGCHRFFKSLQGHRCKAKEAARSDEENVESSDSMEVSPDVKSWPFHVLSDISYESIFCSPLTISDVPHEHRPLYSGIVSEILKYILQGKEEEAWKALFLLPRLVFALPRGGKAKSREVSLFLNLFRSGQWEALLARKVNYIGDACLGGSKEKRAISLARAGYMSGALRALGDTGLYDTSDPRVYEELKRLHPASQKQGCELHLKSADVIQKKDFKRVISKLLPRRSADAAGWRGEYFKRLSAGTKDLLFKLAQQILQNPKSIPEGLRPFLFGARLVAAKKPGGGVRPIAVGTILRKVISCALTKVVEPQLQQTFCPHQYGVGIPGGAENVVQGLRIAQASMGDCAIAEIDFTNAFNTVERSAIAEAVDRYFPHLKTWFELCYGRSSLLLVKDQRPIRSERGVQQGDPLGPFLFALALQPALEKAAENGECHVVAYLDDVYICGRPESVASAARRLIDTAAKVGLTCNVAKCWATRPVEVEGMQQRLNYKVAPDVLGAPLNLEQKLQADSIPLDLMKRVGDLSDLQTALHLLRYIHNSRFSYSFRLSSGRASQDLARSMMKATRGILAKMLNCEELSESSWRQALLPSGPGLGLTDLEEMAPYMAHASILEAIHRLAGMDSKRFGDVLSDSWWARLPDSPIHTAYTEAVEALKCIKSDDMRFAKLQQLFATRIVTPKNMENFLNDPSTPNTSKAIVASAANSELAPAFLHAIPTTADLSLSTAEMQISLRLLLGVQLKMCDSMCDCERAHGPVPLTMYHALSCKHRAGLIDRHEWMKDVFAGLCKSARLPCEVEPRHVLGGTKKRPDFLIRFAKGGQDAAYDLTVQSPLRDSHSMARTIRDEQGFLRQAERTKRNKYASKLADEDTLFYPIVFSAFGGVLNESYHDVIEWLIGRVKKDNFEPPNWAASSQKSYWLQKLAIALWRGNAYKVCHFLPKKKENQRVHFVISDQ